MAGEYGKDKSGIEAVEKGVDVVDNKERPSVLSPESIAQEEAASNELVNRLTAEAAALYHKLSAEGTEAGVGEIELTALGDELEAIALEMNGLLEKHQLELKALEEALQSAETLAIDMPDVFSPEDITAMKDRVVGQKGKEHHTEKIIEVATRGQEEVKKHIELKQTGELQKEKEIQKRQSFVEGINNSGIDKKIVADGLEISHPEVVQKFVAAKLDALSADKRASITADIDKQISGLQVEIDNLANQFKESDDLVQQRAKVESIKDKFPDQYTKATAILESKKQVELGAFVKEKAKDLVDKIQILEVSKQQAETEFVKKEFADELLGEVTANESIDIQKFSEGIAEKIDPAKLSLLEVRRLPAEIISKVIEKASDLQIVQMEKTASPIMFTKEYAVRQQKIFDSIRELFDSQGHLKDEVIKNDDALLVEGRNPDNKISAGVKERELWQKVQDAVAVAYARSDKPSPFANYSLDINEPGMSKNEVDISMGRIRSGLVTKETANRMASPMWNITRQEGNVLEGLLPYAEQLSENLQQAKDFSKGPFPSPDFKGQEDYVGGEIKKLADVILRNSEIILELLRDLSIDNNDNRRRQVEEKMQMFQNDGNEIKAKFDDYQTRAAEAKSREDARTANEQLIAQDRKKYTVAMEEYGPILEVNVVNSTADLEGLNKKKTEYVAQIRDSNKTLDTLRSAYNKFLSFQAQVDKTSFGFIKGKAVVPVFSDSGEDTGGKMTVDKAGLAELMTGINEKISAKVGELNGIITDANKNLEASKKTVLKEINDAIEQAENKFRYLKSPDDIDKLKSLRDQTQNLVLQVTYQSK